MSNSSILKPLPKYLPFSEALKRWGFDGLDPRTGEHSLTLNELNLIDQYFIEEGLNPIVGGGIDWIPLEMVKPLIHNQVETIKPLSEWKELEKSELQGVYFEYLTHLIKEYTREYNPPEAPHILDNVDDYRVNSSNYIDNDENDTIRYLSVSSDSYVGKEVKKELHLIDEPPKLQQQLSFDLEIKSNLGFPFSICTHPQNDFDSILAELDQALCSAFILDDGQIESILNISASFIWLERDNLKRFEQKTGIYDHGIDLDKDGEPLPPYLDKESPYYALEMEIVVKAHEDIIIKGWNKRKVNNQWKDVKTKRSVKDKVESWVTYELEERGIKEPDNIGNFYKRIAVLINPIIHKLSPARHF